MRQVTYFPDPEQNEQIAFFFQVLHKLLGEIRGRRACDLTHRGKCPTTVSAFFPRHTPSAVKRRTSAFSEQSWPAQARPSRSVCYERYYPAPPPLFPKPTPELSRSRRGRQQLVVREPLSHSEPHTVISKSLSPKP